MSQVLPGALGVYAGITIMQLVSPRIRHLFEGKGAPPYNCVRKNYF